MTIIFELQVWHRADQACFFLLQWQDRTQQLTASLAYSREVQQCYQRWQQRYLRYYELSAPQVSQSGSLKPGTGDPAHDLMQAEQELVRSFQNWLAEGETRKLQQQIWEELSRLTHQPDCPTQSAQLFLAIDTPDLARLPWETWELAPNNLPISFRVTRTAMQVQPRPQLPTRHPKPRILVILGEDSNLSLQAHWQALQPLRSRSTLQRLTWSPQEDAVAIKAKILQTIADDRGWEVLVFMGHSQETAITGGRVVITPQVVLATSELAAALTTAYDRGLQLAIFNSCSGLDIAHSLVQLGLQVVAMREPIRADVAQQFLHHLCQDLAKHQSIQSAIDHTCQHLKTTQQFVYPSAALLPLLFSPSYTAPYQFAQPRWQQWLQPLRPSRQWLPTPLEAFTLALMLVLSSGLGSPVTDWLMEMRYLMQAVYYDVTNQLPSQKAPSVLLIGIDQASIDRAKATLPDFTTFPLDRRYLAQLVTRTATLKSRVLGIDYLLDTEEPHQQQLTQAMRTIVATKQTWLVLAVFGPNTIHNEPTKRRWSLKGNAGLYLSPPEDVTCPDLCPFTYLLTVASLLTQPTLQPAAPQPRLDNQGDFQLAVSGYLRQWLDQPDQSPIARLPLAQPPLGLSKVTDFALPPDHAYQFVPAWQLLSTPPSSSWLQTLDQPVIMIASAGYAGVEDSYGAFLYNQYWCNHQPRQQVDCSKINGGEIHAQNIHELLSSHQILRIPDAWMLCLAAILGKGITLQLRRQSSKQRRRSFLGLAGATGLYGGLSLQTYISATTLVPWFLPSLLIWIYLGLNAAGLKGLRSSAPPKSRSVVPMIKT